MNCKKVIKILAIVLLIVILLFLGAHIVGKHFFSGDTRIYESNWNIDIPSGLNEEYSKKDKQDFQGDGYRYTVFSVKKSNKFFKDGFSSQKNTKLESDINQILVKLNVNNSNKPDFAQKYTWKLLKEYDNSLYIVYYAQEQKAYFIQNMR